MILAYLTLVIVLTPLFFIAAVIASCLTTHAVCFECGSLFLRRDASTFDGLRCPKCLSPIRYGIRRVI